MGGVFMSFDIMSFLMGKAAGGGGGSGGSDGIFDWDLKSATPLVDKVRGMTATNSGVFLNENGAVFDAASDYLWFYSALENRITIEIDVVQMSLGTGNTKRVVNEGLSNGNGLCWNYNGKWAFTSGNSTVNSEITDSGYFDGHTLKIVIDSESKWHIYRDSDLVFEPNVALSLSQRRFNVGASSKSIDNAIISAVRVY